MKHTSSHCRNLLLPTLLAIIGILLPACSNDDKGAGARGARAVPVVVAQAIIGDLPVVLSGLGTVTPTDVVTVKTRVNGELLRVRFTEGNIVHAGALLAEIDPRPYEVQLMQVEGQMAKNKAAYTNALEDLERYKSLVSQNIISKQQLDTQSAQVDQLAAALKSDEGSIASAKLNLTYCKITAPISGRVGLRLVDPGNLVSTTDLNGIVVITSLSPIHVSFSIPADSIGRVIGKNNKNLVVEAWDRDSSTKLTSGKLWAVDNQVDPATGTVKLKALFDNKDSSLFPNQFVNVQLFVDTLKSVVLVPSAAVQKSPQGNFVYAIKGDSTVEMRLVEVLASQGDQTALKTGISVGETVVTDGIERLRPGAAITIPAANPKPQRGEGATEDTGNKNKDKDKEDSTKSHTQGSGKSKS